MKVVIKKGALRPLMYAVTLVHLYCNYVSNYTDNDNGCINLVVGLGLLSLFHSFNKFNKCLKRGYRD